MKPNRATLSVLIPIADGEPPKEVRLFKRGANPTSKGTYVFDDAAAQSVMREYEAHGTDIMLDLEHLSLDTESQSFDPDARGWAGLELRNGELWLTNISWNEDGDRRLRKKTQRYLSPVFDFDAKTKQVLSIFNVAITAIPATHNPQPLVAANEREGYPMKSAICKLLNMPEETADEEVLKALAARLADKSEGETVTPEEKKELPMLKAIALAARKHTGKEKPEEIEAVLTALAASRTSMTELSAEVAQLRAGTLRTELRELCRANPKKIASEKLEGLVMKCSSVDAASALIEALPEVVTTPVTPIRVEGGSDTVELTAEEKDFCKLTGESPVSLLEYKKKQAATARAAS